jgi:Fic family protein
MSYNPIYPFNLPLLPPLISFESIEINKLLLKARTELAELKGCSLSLPNPRLLLSPAIIKESVASSNIENINTTVIEVLQNQLFPEIEQSKPDKEVLRYREAIDWGFDNIKKYSMSTRLILGIQKKLIPESHGEYRAHQNRIENSTTKQPIYTPPIASHIPRLMSNLENYLNNEKKVDPLIKTIIGHYQFESIHPFNDGNGRVGRILMVLQLINDELLFFPILYISGFINKHRSDYYHLLRKITSDNKWLDFVAFMLDGFHQQAKETKNLILKIKVLYFEFKKNLKTNFRKIYSADLVDNLFSYPIITPVRLAKELGSHYTTTSRYLAQLSKAGVLQEAKMGKYHLFINKDLISLMKK